MMTEHPNVNLLSEQALYAVAYAEEEARLLGSGYVGTEHLLLGLLRDGESVSGRALAELGITWEAARDAVARGVGGERMGHVLLAMAPGALRAVALAQYEAESAGHAYVGTHHLLLALTRDVPNVAMTMLGQQGIAEARLRQQVAATLERADNPADDLAPALRRPMLASRARELLCAPRPGPYQASAPLTPPALPEEYPVPSVRGVQWTAPSSSPERFDKFTERGRLVLKLAQEEAQRFNHNYIGTKHLLLGFLRIEDSTGMRVLRSIGVDSDRARSAVEFLIGRGDRIVLGDIGLTPRAKKVIELAVDEARRLGQHYIGTDHLLLGMVREGEGIAAGVLESLGVNLENARRHTITVLSERDARPASPPAPEPPEASGTDRQAISDDTPPPEEPQPPEEPPEPANE